MSSESPVPFAVTGGGVGEMLHSVLEMCRSIKRLRERDVRATDEEIEESALQFVRKISGYRRPSLANEAAFDAAVEEIAASSRRLLDSLTTGQRSS